jgi:hypothetical protein
MSAIEYTLIPEGLKMQVTTRMVSHFGDKDLSVGGIPITLWLNGYLQKVRWFGRENVVNRGF